MSSVAAHQYDSSNIFIHQACGQDNTTYNKELQSVGINSKFMTDGYLQSTFNQFDFKRKHGTEMCVCVIKELIRYYIKIWFF